MHMSMTGSNGILSVPSEHVPGLIALVATPLVLWALVALVGRASGRGRPWAQHLDRRLRDLPFAGKVVAVAMVIGATVHAAIVPTHWGDDQVLAILFVVDALGFLVAAWWTVTGRRHWPSAAAAMLGGTVAGYAFYLVRGWETPDPVGLLTSTVELAGFFVVVLAGHSSFADPERRRRMVAASVGGALAILVGTVVATGSASGASASAASAPAPGSSSAMGSMTPGGSDSGSPTPTTMPGMGGGSAGASGTTTPTQPGMAAMGSTGPGSGDSPSTTAPSAMPAMGGTEPAGGAAPAGSGSSGMRGMGDGPSPSSPALSLATTSPAGNITWPLPMGTMGPGMQMVTPDCTAEPTAAEQQAAVSLVDQTVTDVAKFQSLDAAKTAGYVPITPSGLPVVHYADPAYLRTPQTLQPGAIESLVYANTARGAVLVAAMYAMGNDQIGAAPPMPGGCLTEWHVHTNLCFSNVTGTVVGAEQGDACPPGSFNRVTQPMLHVWLAPIGGGPLAVDAPNPQIVAAAAKLPVPNPPNPTA